jgi:hypothetical protein
MRTRRIGAGSGGMRISSSLDYKNGMGLNQPTSGEDEAMQLPKILISTMAAVLLFSWTIWAQDKIDRELEIHKNIKLVMLTAASDLPEDVVKQYQVFLPILESSLKEITSDQPDDCSLTLKVGAAVKEVGAAKTKRPQAKITAFRRNSKQEYQGAFLLYSYISSGPVTKEETNTFLKKQILEPAECRKPE